MHVYVQATSNKICMNAGEESPFILIPSSLIFLPPSTTSSSTPGEPPRFGAHQLVVCSHPHPFVGSFLPQRPDWHQPRLRVESSSVPMLSLLVSKPASTSSRSSLTHLRVFDWHCDPIVDAATMIISGFGCQRPLVRSSFLLLECWTDVKLQQREKAVS